LFEKSGHKKIGEIDTCGQFQQHLFNEQVFANFILPKISNTNKKPMKAGQF